MTRYSVQPRDRIFVKGYRFLFFDKNMGRNIGKNTIKNLSSKYSQKPLDHAKQSTADTIKTASKREIQKKPEKTSDFAGNKIADKITKVSKVLPKNNSETNEKEMLRERFIPPELRRKIINDLRLKEGNR